MLDIRDLTVTYELGRKPGSSTREVLKGLSLQVERGEFLVILGASGSGKSTLLRTLAGLQRVRSGKIFLDGLDLSKKQPHQRDIALVFQSGGWYDHMTVRQHFQLSKSARKGFFSRKTAGKNCSEPEFWLNRMGLASQADQTPKTLSGGQLQRLAIGRAVMRGKSVLLLDEPLSQLDQLSRNSLRSLMRDIHDAGQTIVYVTHDQQDAFLLGTRIAVLDGGVIQQIGTPRELYENPQHVSVAKAFGFPPMEFFEPSELPSLATMLGPTPARILAIRPCDWTIHVERREKEIVGSVDCKTSIDTASAELPGQWSSCRLIDGMLLAEVETNHRIVSVVIADIDFVARHNLSKGKPCWLKIALSKVHQFENFDDFSYNGSGMDGANS